MDRKIDGMSKQQAGILLLTGIVLTSIVMVIVAEAPARAGSDSGTGRQKSAAVFVPARENDPSNGNTQSRISPRSASITAHDPERGASHPYLSQVASEGSPYYEVSPSLTHRVGRQPSSRTSGHTSCQVPISPTGSGRTGYTRVYRAGAGSTASSKTALMSLFFGGHRCSSVDDIASANWAGYSMGMLDNGSGAPVYTQVSATWRVPVAISTTPGQTAYSATWVGIGGGCILGCLTSDQTLIQAGTMQNISQGKASYSAWLEALPQPAQAVPSLKVSPGDMMSVDIEQVVPGVWSITMRNLTSGQSFSTLMAYLSTMLTVEWIEEAPLIISGSQGAYIATLPRLSTVQFSDVTANGIRSGTTPLDGIEMVSPKGTLEAVPSSPVGNGVEFNVCTYTARCPAP